jgi:hypothetical protein
LLWTSCSRVSSVGSPLQQVEHDLGAEPAGADAEPGEAQRVGDPATAGGAEEGAEPAARVDHASPAVTKPDPFQLRERGKEVRREGGEGGGPLIVGGPDAAAEVVDGVVAAPQDPVVRSEILRSRHRPRCLFRMFA